MMRQIAILLATLAVSVGANLSFGAPGGQSNGALREVSSAQHEINIVITSLRRDFEQSSDLVNARSMLRTSLTNYREMCDSALAPLRDSVEYKRLSERITTLEQKLTWGNFDDRMTPAQLAVVAQSLLDARRMRSTMEAKAISNDPDVAKARNAMIDANGKLVSLQREFNQSIVSNPQFVAAKAHLEAAHVQASGRH